LIGRLLWTSIISESPSGRIERRLSKSLLLGRDVILGLASDNEMDASKLETVIATGKHGSLLCFPTS
jgi:hypothetical protein